MENSKKTAIVILTYNNLEYSKNCLESIRKYTESGTYEIIVVDNCSTDGTREWLTTQTDIKVLLNDYNAGFPKGCNMGIELALENSDILLLNNDTVVTARWLENLKRCLYSDHKIGAVGAVCNHHENLQGLDLKYTELTQMQELGDRNNISDSGRWEEKIFLIGFCLLIKREVLNKVGLLDEAYTPGYVEDNDFSLRIVTAGYKLMLCYDCFIHHYLGSGFRKDLSRFYPILYKNRETFIRKWGFVPFAFDEIKFASLRLFTDTDQSKQLKILELGCGIGATLLKLKKEHPHIALYGIEPDKNMATISKYIATVSTKPVDHFPLEFPEEYFDYILIGNLLEKTADPQLLINQLRKYLKEDGYLICEVQNVMHYDVLRNLLKGKWLHTPKNVNLDKSNRTFFTLDDIHQLFSDCHYKNPFILHWYSVPSDEENAFIQKLSEIGNEQRAYLFKTHLFSIRFQK